MHGVQGKLVILVALACVSLLAIHTTAGAGHVAGDCGIVSQGSRDYRVKKMKMSCEKARKGAKRYLRTGKPRRGFDCAPTGEGFYCQDPPKAYWAVRL